MHEANIAAAGDNAEPSRFNYAMEQNGERERDSFCDNLVDQHQSSVVLYIIITSEEEVCLEFREQISNKNSLALLFLDTIRKISLDWGSVTELDYFFKNCADTSETVLNLKFGNSNFSFNHGPLCVFLNDVFLYYF